MNRVKYLIDQIKKKPQNPLQGVEFYFKVGDAPWFSINAITYNDYMTGAATLLPHEKIAQVGNVGELV